MTRKPAARRGRYHGLNYRIFLEKQSTDLQGLARLGGVLPRYRFQLQGLDPRLRGLGGLGVERSGSEGGGEVEGPWLELWRDEAGDAEGQETLMT